MEYELIKYDLGNGRHLLYRRLPSGTCYHAETPEPVIETLERVRQDQRKIRLFYGNAQTGQSWFEQYDVIGRIGRSMGPIKVPLLIEAGEIGGPALLDHCIIRIDTPRKTLYQHGQFRVGEAALVQGKRKRLPWEVWIDQIVLARFKERRAAQCYLDFIKGNRFTLT